MKAELSIKLISYFAPNCPRRIVAPNCPRRIVQRRIVRSELSCDELSGNHSGVMRENRGGHLPLGTALVGGILQVNHQGLQNYIKLHTITHGYDLNNRLSLLKGGHSYYTLPLCAETPLLCHCVSIRDCYLN